MGNRKLVWKGGGGGGSELHNEQVALLEAGADTSNKRHEGHEAAADYEDNWSKTGQVAQVLSVFGIDIGGVEVENGLLVVCFDNCAGGDEQAADNDKTWHDGDNRTNSSST
jgi:hypothetical protein